MKLGIVVVYLVAEEDEALLDLHLSQIEKCTQAPHCTYASANRLLPRFRARIEQFPHIRICDVPGTSLRYSQEHAYYLDRLIEKAIDDGATHVCTLHVDSFPVTRGWAFAVASKLNERCVLAGSLRDPKFHRKPSTDFMMFTREFYLRHRPTMLLSPEVMASAEYQRYQAAFANVPDSGVGYGFKIWSERLHWLAIPRAAEAEDSYHLGSLFGGLVFHLGGAVRNHADHKASGRQIRVAQMLGRCLPLAKTIAPAFVKESLRGAVEKNVVRPKFDSVRTALLADPEGFLRQLRSTTRIQGEWATI
ncbi:MAG TPA: hypothetical protein VEU96_06455 [Bryobacteraceae bacterium]|nr:hypothetical protein [Bryobacteraceae bacterium]